MVKSQSKIFEGIYREQMPLLRKEGLRPLTAEQIMRKRLGGELSFETYYDTSTGIFYAGDNKDKFKIYSYLQDLANLTPKTPLYNGGIEKTDEDYKASKVQEFSRKDMILGKRLTEEQALTHLGWTASLNGNKKLLEKVVQYVFKRIKDEYREDKAMGFHLRDLQGKPNIRALYLDWLDGGADAYGYDVSDLDYDARLVGVRKSGEATSQKVLPYTKEDIAKYLQITNDIMKGKTPNAELKQIVGLLRRLR